MNYSILFILKKDLANNKLHHAYCLEGNHDDVFPIIYDFLENELYFEMKGNPDFWSNRYETLGIEEARVLKDLQTLRPARGGKKIFIISANFITREAQNSLLKIFEEPALENHFFLIIPSSQDLLPTLRSRLSIIKGELVSKHKRKTLSISASECERCTAPVGSHANTYPLLARGNGQDTANDFIFAKEFMEASKGRRIALLKTILEDKDTAKTKAISFLNNLEKFLYSFRLEGSLITKERMNSFERILEAKKYINDKSANVKIILENIALMLE